ncbi:LLM class F420-dependent oxidoreductase [Candidatus Poriferisodalis sp.]|uniref:LLM class F420-dependent oxidoreductase n=1 Tax=Candidatus Poriferisodalis sp. TaxID=3101277 RepID=UPI003B02B734
MKFGMTLANTGPQVDGATAVAYAQEAEAAGFESLWTVEHVVVPEGYQTPYPYAEDGKMPGKRDDIDIPDPLMWMAFVASVTSEIKLGTGILIVPQRNFAVTAKAVATLDRLAGGRVLLGIGAGWMEEEFDALGVSFADRGDITDEHLEAYQSLWRDDVCTYKGKHVAFDRVYCRPQPVGPVPIIVGGDSKRAARRAGEHGDGFFPVSGDLEEMSMLYQHAKRCAEAAGRDPENIEFTTMGPATHEWIEQVAAIGVSRLVVYPMARSKFDDFSRDVITAYADA